MSNVVTQAPAANFAIVTTATVVAVATQPSPLTNMLRRDLAPPGSSPVRHHTRLGQGKRQESADGIQRDQPVRDTAKQDQEHGAQSRQGIDPLRVHKPPAARAKAIGEIPVLSDGAAESRKIRKGGVSR